MYVLERIEAESERLIHASPDQATVERLLLLILRARIRSTHGTAEREHLRAAQFRLRVGAEVNQLITLAGEHFRIREDLELSSDVVSNSKSLRRVARELGRFSPEVKADSSVAAAIEKTKMAEPPAREQPHIQLEERPKISGERFEI